MRGVVNFRTPDLCMCFQGVMKAVQYGTGLKAHSVYQAFARL